MEMSFHSHAIEAHFHKKGFALGLILKVRVFGTRRWPMHFTNFGIMNTQVRLPADQFCRVNRQNIGVRASQQCVAVARGRLAAGAPLLFSLLHRHRKKIGFFPVNLSAVIACLFILRKLIDETPLQTIT